MEISLSFPPCPHDTFIFYALLHSKIKTSFSFRSHILDIKELNSKARKYDIVKVASLAYGKIANDYVILQSGSTFGNGWGPLLLGKEVRMPTSKDLIAIPGEWTTANFLLKLYLNGKNIPTQFIPFDQIMAAIFENNVNYGVVINEARLTYQNYNLKKITDLGKVWQIENSLPVPLAVIAAKRSLGHENIKLIQQAIYDSIQYAFANFEECREYTLINTSEVDKSIIEQHIKLYVNCYTENLDVLGRKSLRFLLNKACQMKLIEAVREDIFI